MQIIRFALGPPTEYSRWALGDSAAFLKFKCSVSFKRSRWLNEYICWHKLGLTSLVHMLQKWLKRFNILLYKGMAFLNKSINLLNTISGYIGLLCDTDSKLPILNSPNLDW